MASAAVLRLTCAVCGVESEGRARDWRALLGREDDDTVSVEVICSTCAVGEFGDA